MEYKQAIIPSQALPEEYRTLLVMLTPTHSAYQPLFAKLSKILSLSTPPLPLLSHTLSCQYLWSLSFDLIAISHSLAGISLIYRCCRCFPMRLDFNDEGPATNKYHAQRAYTTLSHLRFFLLLFFPILHVSAPIILPLLF